MNIFRRLAAHAYAYSQEKSVTMGPSTKHMLHIWQLQYRLIKGASFETILISKVTTNNTCKLIHRMPFK